MNEGSVVTQRVSIYRILHTKRICKFYKMYIELLSQSICAFMACAYNFNVVYININFNQFHCIVYKYKFQFHTTKAPFR